MYLETDEFPGCCGIDIIYDFEDLESHALDPDERKSQIESFLGELPDEKGDRLYLVALTDQQLSTGWRGVLRKKGFRQYVRFINKNTGNYVTLFGFTRSRPKAKAKAKAMWK